MANGRSLGLAVAAAVLSVANLLGAAVHTIELGDGGEVAPSSAFQMGAGQAPSGETIGVDGRSLLRDGRRWMPVAGEFHYTRYPAAEWREELLKMKAGGVDLVSTYVFWIHHEEVEGKYDWSGQRDLRTFAETCREVGMPLVVRIGPWGHGEVRNGGFPDWLLTKSWKLRSDDPQYLQAVKGWYGEIGRQLKGLMWKDGGSVIGVQVENEFWGPGEHLVHLKEIAREAGLDVPLYTRTGWPGLKTPVPFGQLVPLYGAYAEGFWDRSLESMPGHYWQAFAFLPVRTDVAVATDQLGKRKSVDEGDASRYPYLCCEMGGGMETSYHRRIHIEPRDVEATALVKIGSGSNLPGYYMYHGGTNPESETGITLQESQATHYPNDMPVKSYDFLAPLGECGEVRESYHRLRRLHLMVHEWGSLLAGMSASFPAELPKGRGDAETLRWAVRAGAGGGFLFVNNYQRGMEMPAKAGVQFSIRGGRGETITLPAEPVSVPADSSFVWPFNLELGGGATLTYATAQPVTALDEGDERFVVFAETPGVPAEFAFAEGTQVEAGSGGSVRRDGGLVRVGPARAGLETAATVTGKDGRRVGIILLDEATSLRCWKLKTGGRDRVILCGGDLVSEGGRLRVEASAADERSVKMDVLPGPETLEVAGEAVRGRAAGAFRAYEMALPDAAPVQVTLEQVQAGEAAPQVHKGPAKVAEAPAEEAWKHAACWRVKLPVSGEVPGRKVLLRVHYVGDAARVYVDGKLIADNFFNGEPMDVGLWRLQPLGAGRELTVKVLPMASGAPIYLEPAAQRAIDEAGASGQGVKQVEIIENRSVTAAVRQN